MKGAGLDEYSDKVLAQQAQAGDGSAYETLITRHYRRVYAVCLGIVADTHEAQDMCQETMLAGFTKIDRLRETGQFGSWLVQIARNLCLDRLRKRKVAQKFLAAAAARPAGENDPSSLDLNDAIAQLPMELRVPLVMYYFDGRDCSAIAEQLGLSASTVCRRLCEARRCLYELLNEVDK